MCTFYSGVSLSSSYWRIQICRPPSLLQPSEWPWAEPGDLSSPGRPDLGWIPSLQKSGTQGHSPPWPQWGAVLWKWPSGPKCRVLQQHLGLWPVGVEDVGVIGAVHHLTAGFVVFVAAAVGAVGLGSMAVCRHPVTCITHNAFLLYNRREGGKLLVSTDTGQGGGEW